MLFHSIQDGVFEFPDNEWRTVSVEAKDLICKLLVKNARQRLSAEMVLAHPWVKLGGSTRPLVTPQNIRRNNSARELSAFAESAMAVNRVVLQHMSLNLIEDKDNEDEELVNTDELKENIPLTTDLKRKAPLVFGLSPPSESKLLQRRSKQYQSLSLSCCLERKIRQEQEKTDTALKSDLVKANVPIIASPSC
jgi:MAP kinase interacting serine/threonine kinase